MEASEDSQLEAAIQASLHHQTSHTSKTTSNNDSDDDDECSDDLETFSASDDDSMPADPKFGVISKISETGSGRCGAKNSNTLSDSFCNTALSSNSSVGNTDSNDKQTNGVTNCGTEGGCDKTKSQDSNSGSGDGDSEKTVTDSDGTVKEEKWKEYLGDPNGEDCKSVL